MLLGREKLKEIKEKKEKAQKRKEERKEEFKGDHFGERNKRDQTRIRDQERNGL